MKAPAPSATHDAPGSARWADWRTVAIPREHGGWSLTLEPVLLGLFIAPSAAGGLIGFAALVAFVARTPLKVVLVDARRDRELSRTALARRILAVELATLLAAITAATVLGDARLWLPALVAAPLVGTELWFDMRSRSRRLVPELAGAVGISSVTAMIMLADGAPIGLAAAMSLVLAARALTSIPFVRSQIDLLHDRATSTTVGVISDVAALGVVGTAVMIDRSAAAGAVIIAAVIAYQRVSGIRPPTRAVILGVRQTVVGLTVVLVTALGALAP